jgi:beta-lactamase class A
MTPPDLLRRGLVACIGLAPVAWTGVAPARNADPAAALRRFRSGIERIERSARGRLGVAVLDASGTRLFSCRGSERFLMCSTFKVAAVAAVLRRAELGSENLARAVGIDKSELLPHSPVTQTKAGGTMTLRELCEATVQVSDNAAANKLLRAIGGPAGLTAFVRAAGDTVTRLDRYEVELNRPGTNPAWDTTSPVAMAKLLRTLLYGQGLTPQSQRLLRGWMAASTTGLLRLRAGLPAGWAAGDKTGNSDTAANDIAWVQPPGTQPWLITAYFAHPTDADVGRDTVLPAVARLVSELIGATPASR